MKKVFIDWCLKKVQEGKKYTEDELEQIEYGLVSIYLLITKLIVILLICCLLGIVKEALIFMILYNIIRMPSFGLHASKSWICLLVSSIIFVGLPIIMLNIDFNLITKTIIGLYGVIFMYFFSPADTHKRPIVNKKRREIYKILSVLITFIFTISSIVIKDGYICNCLLFSIIIQTIIISPLTYKLFNMPYNNYKTYLENMV